MSEKIDQIEDLIKKERTDQENERTADRKALAAKEDAFKKLNNKFNKMELVYKRETNELSQIQGEIEHKENERKSTETIVEKLRDRLAAESGKQGAEDKQRAIETALELKRLEENIEKDKKQIELLVGTTEKMKSEIDRLRKERDADEDKIKQFLETMANNEQARQKELASYKTERGALVETMKKQKDELEDSRKKLIEEKKINRAIKLDIIKDEKTIQKQKDELTEKSKETELAVAEIKALKERNMTGSDDGAKLVCTALTSERVNTIHYIAFHCRADCDARTYLPEEAANADNYLEGTEAHGSRGS